MSYPTITGHLLDHIAWIDDDNTAGLGLSCIALLITIPLDVLLAVIFVPAWILGWVVSACRKAF